jgi:peptidoglycan/xylan/chitin deacetylase (PgdA/CDA1 family)
VWFSPVERLWNEKLAAKQKGASRLSKPLRRRALAAVIVAVVATSVTLIAVQARHVASARKYAGLSPVCRVDTSAREVALSFDDGPDPAYTPTVLSTLRQFGDKATFFLVGSHAQTYPNLVQQETAAGMEVADHTWSHPHLPGLTAATLTREVSQTRETIVSNGGEPVTLFRAPYGVIDPQQLVMVKDLGLESVGWSLALDHYLGDMGLNPQAAATALAGDVKPGDIILAHDAAILSRDGGGSRTAAMAALKFLLPELKEAGYKVVTVGQLLQTGAPVAGSPRPWFWENGFTCPRA